MERLCTHTREFEVPWTPVEEPPPSQHMGLERPQTGDKI